MTIAAMAAFSFGFVLAGLKVFAAYRESMKIAAELEASYLRRTGGMWKSITLEAGEAVLRPPAPKACTHWPRDEVKLSDGAVAAYICRRCDHSWANEDWVMLGGER